MISNFRLVLNLVYTLLCISLASDCCMPTFRNTLSVPSSKALKMEQIECSETSAYNNQTTGKYPKEYIEDPKTFCDNMIPDFEKYFEHSNTDQKVVKNFDFKCHFY